MKRQTKITIIIFISSLLIGITIGFVYLSYEVGPPNTYSHNYSVKIKSNSTTPFEVLCPIPIDKDGLQYPHFLEELRVAKGNATLTLTKMFGNSSTSGSYLSIKGVGEVEVGWDVSWSMKNGNRYYNLTGSVTYNSSEPYLHEYMGMWVNSNIGIESFNFNFDSVSEYRGLFDFGGWNDFSDYIGDAELLPGFQLVSPDNYGWVTT